MTAILLFALFSTSAIFALGVIRASWRRHGTAALALRHDLRNCDEWRDVLITTRKITVHPAEAVILRPNFKGRGCSPLPAHGQLPAVA